MNLFIVREALTNYLYQTEDLADQKEIVKALNDLGDNSKTFWANEFAGNNEDIAYHYSQALDDQGQGFYESLPEF